MLFICGEPALNGPDADAGLCSGSDGKPAFNRLTGADDIGICSAGIIANRFAEPCVFSRYHNIRKPRRKCVMLGASRLHKATHGRADWIIVYQHHAHIIAQRNSYVKRCFNQLIQGNRE